MKSNISFEKPKNKVANENKMCYTASLKVSFMFVCFFAAFFSATALYCIESVNEEV